MPNKDHSTFQKNSDCLYCPPFPVAAVTETAESLLHNNYTGQQFFKSCLLRS